MAMPDMADIAPGDDALIPRLQLPQHIPLSMSTLDDEIDRGRLLRVNIRSRVFIPLWSIKAYKREHMEPLSLQVALQRASEPVPADPPPLPKRRVGRPTRAEQEIIDTQLQDEIVRLLRMGHDEAFALGQCSVKPERYARWLKDRTFYNRVIQVRSRKRRGKLV